MKELTISIYETIGKRLCISSGDGQKVYERIAAALKEDCKTTLSFRNISIANTFFLSYAIGQLYSVFSEEHIRSFLSVKDIEQDELYNLKLVVENAKEWCKNPQ